MEKIISRKYYAGIDVGSVSLNCVVINSDRDIVFEFPYQRHFGKTDEALLDLVGNLFDKFGKPRPEACRKIGRLL
jgi:activator of 2-hydroxyglutaryl-CoA dehydratase